MIGFAGAAGTLAPLTELVSFYPPHLPIGSGTSIGTALNHLMNCLDKDIIRNTPEKKGDWKPLIYFMSDGTSTDDTRQAIARWKSHFSHRAKFINIGIGKYADLSTLSEISELTYRLDDDDIEQVYRALCESVADSILSQSRSLGVDLPLSLNKEILESGAVSLIKDPPQSAILDEHYAIVAGLCRKVKLPYLIKYERLENVHLGQAIFQYVGTYAVEKDYEDWSDHRANHNLVAASQLWGGGGCPHCGAMIGLSMCSCGQVFCTDGEGKVVCPGCHETIEMTFSGEDDDFDIQRARG